MSWTELTQSLRKEPKPDSAVDQVLRRRGARSAALMVRQILGFVTLTERVLLASPIFAGGSRLRDSNHLASRGHNRKWPLFA